MSASKADPPNKRKTRWGLQKKSQYSKDHKNNDDKGITDKDENKKVPSSSNAPKKLWSQTKGYAHLVKEDGLL